MIFLKKSCEGKGTVYGRRSRTEYLLRTGESWEVCRIECKSAGLHVLPTQRKLDIQFHELCHSLYTGGGGGNKNLPALSLTPSIVNNGRPSKKMFNCLQSKREDSKSEFQFQAEVSSALLFKLLCSLVKDTSRTSSPTLCLGVPGRTKQWFYQPSFGGIAAVLRTGSLHLGFASRHRAEGATRSSSLCCTTGWWEGGEPSREGKEAVKQNEK